jgi:hypothetical protein
MFTGMDNRQIKVSVAIPSATSNHKRPEIRRQLIETFPQYQIDLEEAETDHCHVFGVVISPSMNSSIGLKAWESVNGFCSKLDAEA